MATGFGKDHHGYNGGDIPLPVQWQMDDSDDENFAYNVQMCEERSAFQEDQRCASQLQHQYNGESLDLDFAAANHLNELELSSIEKDDAELAASMANQDTVERVHKRESLVQELKDEAYTQEMLDREFAQKLQLEEDSKYAEELERRENQGARNNKRHDHWIPPRPHPHSIVEASDSPSHVHDPNETTPLQTFRMPTPYIGGRQPQGLYHRMDGNRRGRGSRSQADEDHGLYVPWAAQFESPDTSIGSIHDSSLIDDMRPFFTEDQLDIVQHDPTGFLSLLQTGGDLQSFGFHAAPSGNDYEAMWELAERLGEVKQRGMSVEQITTLPTATYEGPQPQKKADGASAKPECDTACHICLSEFEAGEELRSLPCCHRFHTQCIDQWITTNATCPVCRVELLSDGDQKPGEHR